MKQAGVRPALQMHVLGVQDDLLEACSAKLADAAYTACWLGAHEPCEEQELQ